MKNGKQMMKKPQIKVVTRSGGKKKAKAPNLRVPADSASRGRRRSQINRRCLLPGSFLQVLCRSSWR